MNRYVVPLLVALLLAACPVAAQDNAPEEDAERSSGKTAPTPVLVDTDPGAYIDDAFALALVLTSPELELRGVTTVGGDAHTRALLVCRLLDAVNRNAIPVAAGAARRDRPDYSGQHQYGLRPAHKRPVQKSAVQLMYEQLKADPGEVTLLALGPLTNVAALLKEHPDAKQLLKRIVLMGGALHVGYDGGPPTEPEWNFRHDPAAVRDVLASGVPLTIAPLDATVSVKLDEARRNRIFRAPSLLVRHLHALYELWDEPQQQAVLYDPVAVSLVLQGSIDEPFCKVEPMRLEVDDRGFCRRVDGQPNARVATAIDSEAFLAWLEARVTRPVLTAADLPEVLDIRFPQGKYAYVLGNRVAGAKLADWLRSGKTAVKKIRVVGGIDARNSAMGKVFRAAQAAGITDTELIHDPETSAQNRSRPVERGGFPRRVHVAEDYETDIERRWWLSGKLETDDVPPGSTRACRGVLCRNFDRRMGIPYEIYKAVIFNPVPGPPMGPNTRLSFRCRLRGAFWLRVQIFTLSKGYHRRLLLVRPDANEWKQFTVDMTTARRPDGSGGPLSADERIDDIQFYTRPGAELLIDDVVLYDAADEKKHRPFPRRVLFTGWFDTGRQGREWPGRFEIVPHDAPRTWKMARSVPAEGGESNEIRVGLRGTRSWRGEAGLDFQYRLTGATGISISLERDGQSVWNHELGDLQPGDWASASLPVRTVADEAAADAIVFRVPKQAQLDIDDVLLYVPGERGVTP